MLHFIEIVMSSINVYYILLCRLLGEPHSHKSIRKSMMAVSCKKLGGVHVPAVAGSPEENWIR